MMPLNTMFLSALVLSSAPLPVGTNQSPVVHWRVELFKVLDDPRMPSPQSGDSTTHETAYAPPTRPSDRESWGPKLEMFVNNEQERLAPAGVTIVNDDDVIALNGISVRVHCWRAVEIVDSRECPLEKSHRIEYVFNPGVLTSADGRRADFSHIKTLEPMDGAEGRKLPAEERAWRWTATGLSVSCDHADENQVSVAELRLAHQLIASQAAHVGIYSERAFPITTRSLASASFWIGPRQTAVVRLPRAPGDGGETIALVKVFLASNANTQQLRAGTKPSSEVEAKAPPTGFSSYLPLPEVP